MASTTTTTTIIIMKTNNLRKVETLIQPFNSLTLIVESESSRILVLVSQYFHVGPKRMDAYGVCPYHLPYSYAPHKLTIAFECVRPNWKSDDWMKIICLNNWQITFSKSLNCNLIRKFMAFYSCHYTSRIWFEFLFVEKTVFRIHICFSFFKLFTFICFWARLCGFEFIYTCCSAVVSCCYLSSKPGLVWRMCVWIFFHLGGEKEVLIPMPIFLRYFNFVFSDFLFCVSEIYAFIIQIYGQQPASQAGRETRATKQTRTYVNHCSISHLWGTMCLASHMSLAHRKPGCHARDVAQFRIGVMYRSRYMRLLFGVWT